MEHTSITDRVDSSILDAKFDYAHVPTSARVAVYDDMKSPPRIIEIPPSDTHEFIENLAACINEQKTLLGGSIPYAPIREVTENFIHAQFKEIVVSILDQGNTIRFCDQGPGVSQRDKAILPGFTSATEPMKSYIRGVGSGLPMVKSYLDVSDGQLTIENNLDHGAVVTISLVKKQPARPPVPIPPLSEKETRLLTLLASEGVLGVKDACELTGIPKSTTQVTLVKMEEAGLVEKDRQHKRRLTEYGQAVSEQIQLA